VCVCARAGGLRAVCVCVSMCERAFVCALFHVLFHSHLQDMACRGARSRMATCSAPRTTRCARVFYLPCDTRAAPEQCVLDTAVMDGSLTGSNRLSACGT
jgi:hypothetical protein